MPNLRVVSAVVVADIPTEWKFPGPIPQRWAISMIIQNFSKKPLFVLSSPLKLGYTQEKIFVNFDVEESTSSHMHIFLPPVLRIPPEQNTPLYFKVPRILRSISPGLGNGSEITETPIDKITKIEFRIAYGTANLDLAQMGSSEEVFNKFKKWKKGLLKGEIKTTDRQDLPRYDPFSPNQTAH